MQVVSPSTQKGIYMLQINQLKLIHKTDYRVFVDGISFTLNPGDRAVIIGEEGEGKSTLLKWIYDPARIEDYAEAEGERVTQGERVGYLPQELSAEEKSLSIDAFMQLEPLYRQADPGRIASICRELGIRAELLADRRPMSTLSGGEKIKIQLARLLAGEPTVLLLDEPSNDIDIETLEWLERFLNQTSREAARRAVLYVSHDETLIENTANRVIHIEQLNHKTIPRHTVANMPYREYVGKRLHAFQLQDSRAFQERRDQRIAEEKWRRIYQRVEHEQNAITRADPSTGRLLKKKMHAVKAQGRRLEEKREKMTEYSQYERKINLRFDYRSELANNKLVLSLELPELKAEERLLAQNVRLEVKGREKVCIIGKNGTGKTTLLKRILEELEKRSDLTVAYMPQEYGDVLDESLSPAGFLSRTGTKEEQVLIHNRLASLRFAPEDMTRTIGHLSGGQRAKLLMLSLTLSGADVLLLDEPTRNFSPLSGPVIRSMLSEFHGAIISVSHDRKFIDEVADKVYRLTPDGLSEQRII